MNIACVTGFAGFIMSHLCKRLLSENWLIYGIDINTSTEAAQEILAHPNFSYFGKDICDLQFLPDCDYIINGAAETHVHNSIIDSEQFIRSNVEGVRNILEIMRKKPENITKRPVLIHFSTDEVYSDTNSWPSCEEDKLNPANPYSASKASADMLIEAWARTYGLEYIIVRPSNNYGTHQHPEKFIPLSIKLALWGRKIRLHNKGTPKRTWLHVEDTCDAILKLIESNSRGVYNLGGELEQTNLSTAYQILKAMNLPITDTSFDLAYTRPGQDMHYKIDCTKLKDLGWKPKKNFDEELPKIVNFYLEKPMERLFS